MAKISIIVPTYNVENYIEECIDSLIYQTFLDIEIIIVNDGSTDNSGLIADIYSKKDKRVRVIHQKNLGLPGARNTGLKVATGEYIGFVDSDDRVKPNMYEVLYSNIMENKSDLSVCNFTRFDRKNYIKSTRYKDDTIFISKTNILEYYKHCLDSSCNKLYKSSIIQNYDLKFESKSIVPQEDFYFLLKYLSHSEIISTISMELYEYRIRKSSITNTVQQEGFVEGCLNFVKITNTYHKKMEIKRDISSFEHYLFVNMLISAIHNSHPSNYKEIEKIIIYFNQDIIFYKAMDSFINNYKSLNNIRGIYEYILYHLYKKNYFKIVSIFEFVRVRRLIRKATNINSYD